MEHAVIGEGTSLGKLETERSPGSDCSAAKGIVSRWTLHSVQQCPPNGLYPGYSVGTRVVPFSFYEGDHESDGNSDNEYGNAYNQYGTEVDYAS